MTREKEGAGRGRCGGRGRPFAYSSFARLGRPRRMRDRGTPHLPASSATEASGTRSQASGSRRRARRPPSHSATSAQDMSGKSRIGPTAYGIRHTARVPSTPFHKRENRTSECSVRAFLQPDNWERGPRCAGGCLEVLFGNLELLRIGEHGFLLGRWRVLRIGVPALISSDIYSLRQCALAGLGIAFVPDAGLPEHLAAAAPLQPVLPDAVSRERPLRVVVPAALSEIPRSKAVLDEVRSLMGET